ncbi:MAG: hypothetical protein IJB11_03185 [Oscillospiraceae bacterium]|nr:hypothetical protein [Oscillospiraceae bacterium]
MEKSRITGKVILYILAALLLLLTLLYLGVTVVYFRFFSRAEAKFLVPGLDAPFVQQGFDYVEEQDAYLVSGYMNDHSASRIYVRYDGGDTRYVELKNADGSDYTGHAGGICHNGGYAYLAGKGGLEVLTLDDVLDGGYATIIGRVETGFDVACCSYYNGHLMAGELYRPGNYETDPSHHRITPDGTSNPALITLLRCDDSAAFGVVSTPVAAISVPAQLQGFCFTGDDQLVLSSSYGFASSYLSYHRIDLDYVGQILLSDTQVPLLYLDSTTLTDSVALPPMSEEIVYRNGQIYVMCESASNKYIFGKFIRGHQVFAYRQEDNH